MRSNIYCEDNWAVAACAAQHLNRYLERNLSGPGFIYHRRHPAAASPKNGNEPEFSFQ